MEIVGYSSGVLQDPATQTLTWTVEAGLGLPPTADGGSYGGPFKAIVLPGWRLVNGELPANRPFACGKEEDETICSVPTSETTLELGTSDLKISSPTGFRAAPGTSVKIPFSLDLASSAAVLPKFTLGAASNLPRAKLNLSNGSFTRQPTDATTKRAPATTRKVIVEVPPSARPGTYKVAMTATAGQGGQATGTAALVVKPPLKPRLRVPRRIRARVASAKGLPVQVVMPVAGSRVQVRLLDPKRLAGGKPLIARKAAGAKRAGALKFRLRDSACQGSATARRRGEADRKGDRQDPGPEAAQATSGHPPALSRDRAGGGGPRPSSSIRPGRSCRSG